MSFKVEIARTGSKSATFDVEAPSTALAIEQALEMAYSHDFGADQSSEYEVTSVTHIEGFKPYRLMLIESPGETPILFECEDENFDHAVEQAEIAYPGCFVFGTEDGSILTEGELEKHGIRVFEDGCRGEGWIWESDEEEAILPTREDALRSATEAVRRYENARLDDQIVAWFEQRVADGDLDIRDLCVRAVRYGRMAPEDFIVEMKERLLLEACGNRAEYYIWHGECECDCDDTASNLLEARKRRDEFIAKGVGAYITDVDNNVIE